MSNSLFNAEEVKIYYQGILDKKAGGRHNEGSFQKVLNFFNSWEERLVSITQQGIYLTEKDST